MEFDCYKCGERKRTRDVFKNHLLSHYFTPLLPSAPPYKCPECNYLFRDKISLMRHLVFYHKKLYEITDLTEESLNEVIVKAQVTIRILRFLDGVHRCCFDVNIKKFILSDYPEFGGLLLLPLPVSNAPDIQDGKLEKLENTRRRSDHPSYTINLVHSFFMMYRDRINRYLTGCLF